MSWPLVKLGSTITFIRGITFKPDDLVEPFDDGSVVVMRTKNVQVKELYVDDLIAVPESFVRRDEQYLKCGDLLISSANSWELVGKTSYVNDLGYEATAGGFISIVRAKEDKIDSRYLYHWIMKPKNQHAIRHCGRQTTNISNLDVGRFKDLEIPLPPLDEQKRIATILDKADAIRRKRQQAIQLADEFLHSVFLELFGDPVTNPKEWDTKIIKDGIKSIRAGWSANGADYSCGENELGVLKISAVTSGVFKPTENKCVEKNIIPVNKKLIHPMKGDLLFSRANTRELVAATCIVLEDRTDVFLPDKLWKIETDSSFLLPEFLNYLVWQPRFKNALTSQATGTSGSMLNISKAKFENTMAIFPDVKSQEIFTKIYWKVQKILENINKSDVSLKELFGALSHKSFSGNL